jgi:WD40 repeat protein
VVSPTDAQTWKWRVRLWDVKTGRLRKTLEQELERSDWIRSIAVSPDSKILATSSDGDSIKLWNLK